VQIIKSSPSSPLKSEYGDFELKPDDGWKISYSFIDYESGLLIVSVSIIDKSKWIDNGYGGRTIPTKEYKIDLATLSVLQPEDWKRYFNYDRKEFVSDDKKYKLVTQRVFEPERNSDGINEELYDLNSNQLLSRGSSIAFRKEKRENLLESLYRSIREKDEQKRLLESKPTLEQYYLMQVDQLKNGDVILCYYDKENVFQLHYGDSEFILSQSENLSLDLRQWSAMKFDVLKKYNSLDDFWREFTADRKWYLKFDHLNRKGQVAAKALILAKHVISFFNDLRKNHNFTHEEHDRINSWSTLVWSEEYKATEIKQWCSNCHKEVNYQPRYPKYICSECASKDKYDTKKNLLEFSNIGFSGGLKITYTDSNGKMIREDSTQDYCECFIDNKLFFAQEARFGGIVIQKKE
jgi:hypothetical protein